jgi:hypothetical protein
VLADTTPCPALTLTIITCNTNTKMKVVSLLLRLCPQTTLLGELRQLGAAISQDIYQESPNVKWSDIAGLTDAKR